MTFIIPRRAGAVPQAHTYDLPALCGTMRMGKWAKNTVRLKPEAQEKLRELAARRGVSVSDIHRRAMEEYILRDTGELADDGRYDYLIGAAEGVAPELSSNTRRTFGEIEVGKHGDHPA